jgi:beta-glucosidase-like glycosyl hydrolase
MLISLLPVVTTPYLLFSGNDKEDERMGSNSIISERALREVYLYPFFLAERLAKPLAYMSRCVTHIDSFF